MDGTAAMDWVPGYSTWTFSARGPLGPWPTEKLTRCPSRNSSYRAPWTADWWKKIPRAVSSGDEPESLVGEPFDRSVRVAAMMSSSL